MALHQAALAAPSSISPVIEPVETIHLRSGELPTVNLTPELLYRILVAEIAAQRGLFDDASQTLIEVGQDTSDPRISQRAFQMAMASHNIPLALRAARQWALLDPENPEAVAASLALSASNGQTQGLAQTLERRIDKAEDRDQAIAQAAGIVSKMTDKRLALDVLEKALHSVVNTSAMAHLALSDAAWASGDAPRALDEARQAQALDANSEDAAQRVLEYGLRVAPAQAIRDTYVYLDAHPGSRALHLLFASRLTAHEDYDQALSLIASMRQRAPEDFDLLYTQAQINTRAGRYDAAKALLAEYISVQSQRRQSIADGASNAQADTSDARLLLVQIAEKEDKLSEAIRQLNLIDEPSLHFQLRIHQAILQGRMGDIASARTTLAALKPADSQERIVRELTLATIYRDAGRSDEAIEVLTRADRDIPDTAEIKYDLAMLLERQGKTEAFETLMKRVIELNPDDANAYNSLGYTYADQGRHLDKAQDLLERALDLEPDNPYILDSVGWYLYRIQDYEAAIEYLRRSYEKLPAADVAAHLGEVLWVSGNRDEARRIWRAGLQQDAQSAVLRDTLRRLGVDLDK
ncbi:tetratricopeptide repeat protein [Alcaligenaceae bacterium CGII-47]|nr:tetratricopeptide repeat protein [Alcaligenaceae bacterium CGII-47]